MGLPGGSKSAVKVAKSTPASTMQDENIQAAGDDVRRRLAAANGRDKSNLFFTSLLQSTSQGGKKNTVG